MKRFFGMFSVILMIFLIAAAGSVAAVEYCAIQDGRTPQFLLSYGITLMPHEGYPFSFPQGSVMLIRQAQPQDILAGQTVLYTDKDTNSIHSGYVTTQIGQDVTLLGWDKAITASDIIGKYIIFFPRYLSVLEIMKTPLALGVYGGVLLLSIILWIALPGRKLTVSNGLSRSDGEISSNLY